MKQLNTLHQDAERAILIKAMTARADVPPYEGPLEELRLLAETAGVSVCGELLQNRQSPDGATYLGSGKVEELKELVGRFSADVVICDDELKPHHVKNLETAVDVKVIDRTELILDIFAQHARTYEAKLQVELAQMEYTFPRLKQMWSHLSRLKAGIGMRGPGEKQLETDRRIVQKRIQDLKAELKLVDEQRQRQAISRAKAFCVSLVGYTNAGKSTLMNAMTGAGVLVEDKLFATLDTRSRACDLGDGKHIVLSDTVGFIRNLPHKLVASFRATLEETVRADLLLHVIDSSHSSAETQIHAVEAVLEEIGADTRPLLHVFNKIDRLQDMQALRLLQAKYPQSIALSAATGDGLDHLKRQIREIAAAASDEITVECSAGNGRLLAWLSEHGEILQREYRDSTVSLRVALPKPVHFEITRQGGVIVAGAGEPAK